MSFVEPESGVWVNFNLASYPQKILRGSWKSHCTSPATQVGSVVDLILLILGQPVPPLEGRPNSLTTIKGNIVV